MRLVITIAGLFIIAAGPVFGQAEDGNENRDAKKKFFYEWTDNAGVIHITDGFGKVPEQYRSKARKIESPKGQEPGQEQPRPGTTYSPGSEESEAARKAEWQNRIREWKNRLASAEKRYRDLERERDDLFRAWGSPALAPIENKQKAEKIEQQMKETQEEIDTARNMIDTVIPEEARKAGVPPGWLRE